MIYQLPSGRIIELSVEQYLSLNDADVQEMNGIGFSFTLNCNNPFYNLFSSTPTPKTTEEDLTEDELEILEDLMSDEEFDSELFDSEYFNEDDL